MTRAITPLGKALRRKQPFRSPGQEATVGLLHTADRVRRALGAIFEPHGVTLQQYNVLRILRGAGDEGLPTLEIAHRMIEQTPGITRLLDRLEAKGLVRRERCRQDRRQVLCWVTAAGLALLADLDAPVAAGDEAVVAALSRDDQTRLVLLLDAIRAGLDSPSSSGSGKP
jgi:DNA-binding MarR family transcriptional regulator